MFIHSRIRFQERDELTERILNLNKERSLMELDNALVGCHFEHIAELAQLDECVLRQ